MKRGLYIGRFQPLHNGHMMVIDYLSKQVDELIIGIGSADASHDVRHPFTAGERILMITRAVRNIGIPYYVIPLEDVKRNSIWAAHVISMVPPFDVVYTSNPLVIQLFKEAGVKVESPEMFQRSELSGTAVREKMITGGDWKKYVPDATVSVIKEIDGIERIQRISMDDDMDL